MGEEEIAAVSQTMASQWMGFGSKVGEFEEAFCKKFDVPNFALVDSGSNALYLAVRLLDLPPGSEIILPSFTWVSCAQSVLVAGHIPRFCDVDLNTMNVTAETIKDVVNDNCRAIMVVHYAGLPVDIDSLKYFGLPIIEDAAHAVCSKYKGAHCGVLADIGIYSFDAVKNLTVGEGGGIASNDPSIIERAKSMRYCGIGKSGFESAGTLDSKWWEYNISEACIKMLPTNIAAAIGIEQLKKIDTLQERRKQIWDYYNANLGSIESIVLPSGACEDYTHSYFTYCIRARMRDDLAKYLLRNGIYTTVRYHPLHLNSIYNYSGSPLVNTEQLNRDSLCIPLHPRLSEADVEYIVKCIRDFYSCLK